MKTKYFLIYVFVGVAFLAVSAWVFFSRGKNAKAIRAKYRLGGILLTCWAMLSVASCDGVFNPGDEIMCYDPEPDYYFTVKTEYHDANWQYSLSPGAVLTVDFTSVRVDFDHFDIVIRKYIDMEEGDVLQRATFESGGKSQFQYTLVYDPADKAYAGTARVDIYAYPEGEEEGYPVYANFLLIVPSAD